MGADLRVSNGAWTETKAATNPPSPSGDFDAIKDGKTNRITTVAQRHLRLEYSQHVLITAGPYLP